ncbi:MAG: hypothetical protein GEU90_00150 [Gemmatimonas sp.]|nr:hypothetical protein [Gemmatimonas sp.]
MAENELDIAEVKSAPAAGQARKASARARSAKATSGTEPAPPRRRAPTADAASAAATRGRRAAATGIDRQPPKTGRGPADAIAAPSSGTPDIRQDLRDFASARPSGWGHDDWLNFLESLRSRGHNVNDRDEIGLALEKERLDIALGTIKGVGPQRRNALLERYANVWELRNADSSEVANAGGLDLGLAERVQAQLS